MPQVYEAKNNEAYGLWHVSAWFKFIPYEALDLNMRISDFLADSFPRRSSHYLSFILFLFFLLLFSLPESAIVIGKREFFPLRNPPPEVLFEFFGLQAFFKNRYWKFLYSNATFFHRQKTSLINSIKITLGKKFFVRKTCKFIFGYLF